jgi:plastocyanin
MKITKSLLTTLLLILPAGCALQAASIAGKVTGGKGITVVYIDAIPGKTFPAPEKHFVMDQKAVLFQPHVLVLPVGATVDFQNSDSVAHNVFWPSIAGNKKDSHNLGTWPKGQVRNFKFDKAGAVPLLCPRRISPKQTPPVISQSPTCQPAPILSSPGTRV